MKSGKEIAKENVAKLRAYLDRVGAAVPRLGNGRVNRSAVAASVPIDRQVFVNNPECRRLIEKLDKAAPTTNKPRSTAIGEEIRILLDRKDREISRLTGVIARQQAELEDLRRQIGLLRSKMAIEGHMGETMRRFPPPTQ